MTIDESMFPKMLGKHLVLITGQYHGPDPKQPSNIIDKPIWYSSFLVDVDGFPFLITAGHCIKSMLEFIDGGYVKTFWLYDRFGYDAVDKIGTVNLPNETIKGAAFVDIDDQSILDEYGIDSGAILIPNNTRELLMRNNISPLTKKEYSGLAGQTLSRFFVFGVPQGFGDGRLINGNMHVKFEPMAIELEYDPELAKEENSKTDHRRFVAKLPQTVTIETLKGLSGGPIFGFNPEMERYWIIAIDTGWSPTRRIVFGCPIEDFMPRLENAIRRVRELAKKQGLSIQ